jgi:prepilin peptidase CpaA
MMDVAIGVELVLLVSLPALLLASAVSDLASFTIPNLLPAGMAILFALFVVILNASGHPLGWPMLGLHTASGFFGLCAGMALFAAGWVGGGDAKLFAVISLWLGPYVLFDYALLATLLGGVLTLCVLALRIMPLPKILHGQAWLLRLADKKSGVPYGIALATAALIMLPATDLFRLASGG